MGKVISLRSSPFECGRVALMRGKLIKKEKFEKLLSLSFEEILKFLEEHGFRESVDSSFLQFKGFYLIERILNLHLSKVYAKIFSSASKKNKLFLETYYLKYQIHNLMVLVRCRESGEEEFEPFLIGDERKKSKFLKAFEMPKLEDGIIYISKKIGFEPEEVLNAYSKGVYFMENYLYKKYYEKLGAFTFKYNGFDEKAFYKFIRRYVDLLNCRTFLKLKVETDVKLDFGDVFIGGGFLGFDFFEKVLSKKLDDVLDIFEKEFSEIDVKDFNSSSRVALFDKKINVFKMSGKELFKKVSFGSPFFILKFLFELESQIGKLRILLKSKYLGLSEEEIERLI